MLIGRITYQLVSDVKFKVKTGSGRVIFWPTKRNNFYRYFVEPNILHPLDVLDLLGS